MCIKIVHSHQEVEFEPTEPLERQVKGARQIIIDYSPDDARIQSFMDQMDRIVKTGVSCQMNIQVKPNNTLNAYRFERKVEKAKKELDLNQAVAMLVKNQSETDQKLCELESICSRGIE
jgi:cell fate (sporulation/competence/biofilm development) regulator YlbF (YheA/YmcA/DUF963 family)